MQGLVSCQRRAFDHAAGRVRRATGDVPKANEIMASRRETCFSAPEGLQPWEFSPTIRILTDVQETLDTRGVEFIDDNLREHAERHAATPWAQTPPASTRVVVVRPEAACPAERAYLRKYLETAKDAAIVVEKPTATVGLAADLLPLDDDPEYVDLPSGSGLVEDAIVASNLLSGKWEPAYLDRQVTAIAGLVGRVPPEQLAIVCGDDSLRMRLLLGLLDERVPVQCHRSELPFFRPCVQDVMALLGLFSGEASVQSAKRVMALVRGFGERRLNRMLDLAGSFTRHEIGRTTTNPRTANDLRKLLPLGKALSRGCIEEVLQAVVDCYRQLPASRRQLPELNALLPGLSAWASEYRSVVAWLREYLHGAIVYDEWLGHRPGSGIRVTTPAKYSVETGDILLYLHAEDEAPLDEDLRTFGTTVLTVPVLPDEEDARPIARNALAGLVDG